MTETLRSPLTTATPARSGVLTGPGLLCASLLSATAILVLFDAWRDIFRIGNTDEECSYVLLAPIVIGWLAWVRRRRVVNCPVSHGWVGLLLLAAGWGVYWYGYIHDPVIWRAGAVFIAAAAFVASVGFVASWRLAPALVGTLFLVPVDPTGRINLAQPLQTATASVTQSICEAFGIYVERAGNLLSINGVPVTVAEACNGIRMVLTLFLVCYVVAFTLPLRAYVRVLLLAASPLVAIVSNVVRLVPTIWMFGHTSEKAAETFHDVAGWVMTVVAFLLLMGGSWLLHRKTGTATPAETRLRKASVEDAKDAALV